MNPRHMHEWRQLEEIGVPKGKVLIPGLLGHANNYVEHPELIAEYICNYASIVGRENVIAGADCGFSSRASYAPEVHPTVVWPKFEALAPSRIDWPEIATACFTPFVARAIFSTRSTTTFVRAEEAASGN